MTDKESGIKTIRYKVIDATDDSLIWSGEIAGQKVVDVTLLECVTKPAVLHNTERCLYSFTCVYVDYL